MAAVGFLIGSPPSARSEDKAPRPATSAAAAGKKASAPARGKKGTPAVTVNVAALTEKLKSDDPADVAAALAEAKAAGKGARAIAPAIEGLLERGTRGELTGLALQALGEVGAETSAPAIAPYCHHRNADTRKKALAALTRIGGASAVPALRAALSDPDPGVRGVAAGGLGTLRGHEAIGDLFTALDHDVGDAAASIGQLCLPAECDKLASKLGTFGLDVMTSAFDSILFRPAAEVPDDAKIRVVERVRDLRTQEANKYLRDVQSRWTPGESARVRQAIDQAVLATAGAKS